MDKTPCSVSYFWHRILHCLEDRLGGVTVAAWLDQTEAVSLVDNKLILKEAAEFRREIITRRFFAMILEIAKEEFGSDIEVVFREE